MFKKYIKFFRNLTLTKKIFLFMTISSVITIITAIMLIFYNNKKNNENLKILRLERQEDQINETFLYLFSSYNKKITPKIAIDLISTRLFEVADINDANINVYDLKGNIKLSTQGINKFNSIKLDQVIINNLIKKERFFITLPIDDKKVMLSNFFYVYNFQNEAVAIVNIPYFYDQFKEKEEFYLLISKFLFLFLFLTIFAAVIAWFFSKTITNKLTSISEKIKNTKVIEENIEINYEAEDEVKVIVSAYNQMLKEIKHQKNMIRLMERELVWKEMAKQVAHEVRNPLTPMSLMIQNFKRTFNPKDPNIINKVNSLSDSLIQQIDVISSISNSFSNIAKLPERKDKNIDLIRETKNLLYMFQENITLNTSDQEIFYIIDEVYYNQIITNLIKNAIQTSQIINRTANVNIYIIKDSDSITIKVKDNGQGIEDNLKSFIFEPKFTTKQTGMGLGLFVIKKIISEYNGTIYFETELNIGTTFIINLPITKI